MPTTLRRNILPALLLSFILLLTPFILLLLSRVILRILFDSLGSAHTDFVFAVSKSDFGIALLGLVLLLTSAGLLLQRWFRR